MKPTRRQIEAIASVLEKRKTILNRSRKQLEERFTKRLTRREVRQLEILEDIVQSLTTRVRDASASLAKAVPDEGVIKLKAEYIVSRVAENLGSQE